MENDTLSEAFALLEKSIYVLKDDAQAMSDDQKNRVSHFIEEACSCMAFAFRVSSGYHLEGLSSMVNVKRYFLAALFEFLSKKYVMSNPTSALYESFEQLNEEDLHGRSLWKFVAKKKEIKNYLALVSASIACPFACITIKEEGIYKVTFKNSEDVKLDKEVIDTISQCQLEAEVLDGVKNQHYIITSFYSDVK